MVRRKREIEVPDLSDPPSADDFFDALKQILTSIRKRVKGESRTPTSTELNTAYRLCRRKYTA